MAVLIIIRRQWAVVNPFIMVGIVIHRTSQFLIHIAKENLQCIHVIIFHRHQMLVLRIIHMDEIIIISLVIQLNQDFRI